MKTSIKTIAATIALSALIAGPASAMVTQSDVLQDVSSAIGGDSSVSAFVSGDTVTITGYFADTGDRNKARQAALANDGIEKVIDLSTVSN